MIWAALIIMAACGGASTPEEAAQAYADAYTRGDGEAVYDMLVLDERKTWDAETRPLRGPRSPRDYFASLMKNVWGSDRGAATVAGLQVDGDQATATLTTSSEPIHLHLRCEDGVWRVSFMPKRR